VRSHSGEDDGEEAAFAASLSFASLDVESARRWYVICLSLRVQLPGPFDGEGRLVVMVESPGGSAAKLKYEAATHTFSFGRPLPSGVVFPFDFGFVAGTQAEDGDPLDALVLSEVATYPGVVIRCEILGILELDQSKAGKRVRNDRLICVPAGRREQSPRLDARQQTALEQFALASTVMTDKDVHILGWGGASAGTKAVERATVSAKPR
jgi:inorganic pyrophosphatase